MWVYLWIDDDILYWLKDNILSESDQAQATKWDIFDAENDIFSGAHRRWTGMFSRKLQNLRKI